MKKTFALSLLLALCVPCSSYAQSIDIGDERTHPNDDCDFSTSSILKSGTAVYTASDHTLTLTNAVIESIDAGSGISIANVSGAGVTAMTIRLVGENKITTTSNRGIWLNDEYSGGKDVCLTFTGSGSLVVNAPDEESAVDLTSYSSTNEFKLVFKDTNVELSGQYGIRGASNGSGTQSLVVEIDNSNMKLTGTIYEGWRKFYRGALTEAKKITLTNCAITAPQGAYVGVGNDTDSGFGSAAILAEGGEHPEVGPVVITAGAHSGIAIPTFPPANGLVYNLQGQRVNNDYRGIAIQNGKKVKQ